MALVGSAFLTLLLGTANATSVVWNTLVPSPTVGNSAGFRIATDLAGNSYVVGSDGDMGTVMEDVFVAKLDAAGTIQWQTTVQDTIGSFDRAIGIELDGTGAVYVGGTLHNHWSLSKYDATGNVQWMRAVGDPLQGQQNPFGMDVESDGHVTMVGRTGFFIPTMVRFDTAGTQLWSVSLPGTASEVMVASDGAIYLAGVKSVNSQSDLWVAKYTTTGMLVWEYTYDAGAGGPIPNDRANGILEDPLGNLVVTGFSWRDLGGTITRDDFTTIKIDTAGNKVWARHHVASNSNDQIRGAAIDPVTGNIYVIGYIFGSSLNTKVVAYDADGNELWTAIPNGNASVSSVYGRSLVVGTDSSVYVSVSRQSVTSRTLILLRYAPDGSLISELEYDTPGLDNASDMEIATTGDLHLVGSQGSGPDTQAMMVLRIDLPAIVTDVPEGVGFVVRPAVLLAPRPNPFNPRTVLGFELDGAAHVRLQVYDARGRIVATLVDEFRSAGSHRATWDGRTKSGKLAPSGAYFARLASMGIVRTQPLILVK